MIKIEHKQDCCGCAACKSACNHGCITMQTDLEGFVYPQIDSSRCIQCGLCDNTCPMINVPDNNSIEKVIAAKNKNETQRFKSSSGGIFRLLAEKILQSNGAIIGCRLNDDLIAEHVMVENMSDLNTLMSSKYVQSNTNGIYEKVRELLLKNRLVLFSGTPCQVAALKNFLIKLYPNLVTIDILCHGVPSPKIFTEYIRNLEHRYSGKAESVSFRWKKKSWKRLYINVIFSNKKRHHLYAGYDSYMQLFLSDKLQRQSCFHCPYNKLSRPGDISLGDFWGIGKKYYDFDDNRGITMVLINNKTGKNLWDSIKDKTEKIVTDIQTAIEGNKVLVKHLPSQNGRDDFYSEYIAKGYKCAIAKFAPEASKKNQVYHDFMRWGLDIVRKIKRQGY